MDGTSASFNQEVMQAPVPVLVVFYATWCSACRTMGPAVAAFAQDEAGKVKVVMINADAEPSLLSAYGVTGLPTCIFFNQGARTSLKQVGSYSTSLADESALISLFNRT